MHKAAARLAEAERPDALHRGERRGPHPTHWPAADFCQSARVHFGGARKWASRNAGFAAFVESANRMRMGALQ